MILAFDTYYFDDKGKTVCVAFEDWSASEKFEVYTETLENIAEYESGAFYKRELPCILSLLSKIDCQTVEAIIVDGFVYLDDENKPGLGAYLFESLHKNIPVIGVAKSNFATLQKNKRALLRGESQKPIFITAIGMELDKAAEQIRQLSGPYRMPSILKALDRFTKEL
ncbi:endonuclease V [Pedobacter sp. KR3-3]|uniref:Endonuclease V n=1 Tax=Pedobacter albus TaxID=3113905 RepID=A0ABU7I9Q5_9SPHI|nr:endonuclease V [Pedobacter sp. KR3-3]MEE1946220.1 endonuclease V [Pedobacter sp. KR3-3]